MPDKDDMQFSPEKRRRAAVEIVVDTIVPTTFSLVLFFALIGNLLGHHDLAVTIAVATCMIWVIKQIIFDVGLTAIERLYRLISSPKQSIDDYLRRKVELMNIFVAIREDDDDEGSKKDDDGTDD